MKSEIFGNLILKAYEKSKEGNLIGVLCDENSSMQFSNIEDIDGVMKESNFVTLYLKSKLTGNEINVCKSELENCKIKESESTIYIKCKNKMEVGVMY